MRKLLLLNVLFCLSCTSNRVSLPFTFTIYGSGSSTFAQNKTEQNVEEQNSNEFEDQNATAETAQPAQANSSFKNINAPNVGGDPESLNVTVFRLWLSPNADCSEKVLVRNYGSDGNSVNVLKDYGLAGATPPEMEVRCVILKVSDNIVFVPNAAAVAANPICIANKAYTVDLYRTDSSAPSFVDEEGVAVAARGTVATAVEDQLVYFFTTSTASLSSSLNPNAQQMFQLSGALSTEAKLYFYADFNGLVDNLSSKCYMTSGDLTDQLGFRE